MQHNTRKGVFYLRRLRTDYLYSFVLMYFGAFVYLRVLVRTHKTKVFINK